MTSFQGSVVEGPLLVYTPPLKSLFFYKKNEPLGPFFAPITSLVTAFKSGEMTLLRGVHQIGKDTGNISVFFNCW